MWYQMERSVKKMEARNGVKYSRKFKENWGGGGVICYASRRALIVVH